MSHNVILVSDVPGLGQVGDQRSVKDGYARNYLLPQGLAVLATKNAVNRAERQKEKLASKRKEQLDKAQKVADTLSKVGLVFERPVGMGGRLFGSVTPMDIMAELVRQGARVEKKSILMHGPIKVAGDHTIRVRVHSQVVVDIPLTVKGIEEKKESVLDEEDAEASSDATEETEDKTEQPAEDTEEKS